MSLSLLWTAASLFACSGFAAYAFLPIPVLYFKEKILEDDSTEITCSLPYTDCLEVELEIISNVTLTECISQHGHNPNITCMLEVTREMDQMEFSCQARFKTRSKPQKMYILTDPEITDCPDKLVWIEGEENSFLCNATGYPPPTVTCMKKGTTYKAGEIFTATRDMSGNFTCMAKNFDKVEKLVSVSVKYKPNIIQIQVKPPLHNEGDTVTLTCEADGNPSPTYLWGTPSSDVEFSADNRTVTIRGLKKSDLGKYMCSVENLLGNDTEEQELSIAVKPKVLNVTVEPPVPVIQGETVRLTCEAIGTPPPVISWNTRSEVELSPDNRTILIRNIKQRDEGIYTCKAQNEHGTDTLSQTVSLAVSPKISNIVVNPPTPVETGVNMTLICSASGVPPPTFSWETPSPNVKFSDGNRTVYIPGVEMAHDGNYVCKAENKAGDATLIRKITVKEGNKGERTEVVTVTIITALIFTYFFSC